MVAVIMLTRIEKQILAGEREVSPGYKRKVLSNARKKARAAVEDLIFLSKIDPKTKSLELDPEFLLKRVTSYLEREKITLEDRLRYRSEVGKPRKIRKGLPRGEKKQLLALGLKEVVRAFDGKAMIQVAGLLRDKKGASLTKNINLKMWFCYELLEIIHRSIKESTPMGLSKTNGEPEPILILSREGDKLSLQCSSLKYPRMILEGKIGLSEAIEALNPEPESIILWRH